MVGLSAKPLHAKTPHRRRRRRNSIRSTNEAAPWGILPQPVGEMLIPHALPRSRGRPRPTCERGQQRGARRSTGRTARRTDRQREAARCRRIIITLMRISGGESEEQTRPLTTTNRVRVLSPSSWAASFELSRSGCTAAAAAFPGMLQPGDILKQSLKLAEGRGRVEWSVCVFSAAG